MTTVLASIPGISDSRVWVATIVGDSMAPELLSGWKVLVDGRLTQPEEDALVAVYIKGQGRLVGRWHEDAGEVSLNKTNPSYSPVLLGGRDKWVFLGTVTRIVDAPILPRRNWVPETGGHADDEPATSDNVTKGKSS